MTDQLPEIKRILQPCVVCDLNGEGNCTCSEWVAPEQVNWLVAEVERLRIDLTVSVESLRKINRQLVQTLSDATNIMPPNLGGRFYMRAEDVTVIRRAEDDEIFGYVWELPDRFRVQGGEPQEGDDHDRRDHGPEDRDR